MDQSKTIKQLSAEFELRHDFDSGVNSHWEVCDKNSPLANPCMGAVTFEHEKLVEVIRRWPQDGTVTEMAGSLNILAAEFVKSGDTSCRLDTVQLRDRFSTDESTLIICGKKQLRIGFITPGPQRKPYILEVLQGTF
jgi:hypothetical protein